MSKKISWKQIIRISSLFHQLSHEFYPQCGLKVHSGYNQNKFQPVTLQCGHSLCRLCSDLLLKEENSRHFTPACSSAGSGRNSSLSLTAAATEEKPIVLMASNAARRRLRPRMGISSFPRPHIYKADSLCSLRCVENHLFLSEKFSQNFQYTCKEIVQFLLKHGFK